MFEFADELLGELAPRRTDVLAAVIEQPVRPAGGRHRGSMMPPVMSIAITIAVPWTAADTLIGSMSGVTSFR